MTATLTLAICTLISPTQWSPRCPYIRMPFATQVECEKAAAFYNSRFLIAHAFDNSARLNEPMLMVPAYCEENDGK